MLMCFPGPALEPRRTRWVPRRGSSCWGAWPGPVCPPVCVVLSVCVRSLHESLMRQLPPCSHAHLLSPGSSSHQASGTKFRLPSLAPVSQLECWQVLGVLWLVQGLPHRPRQSPGPQFARLPLLSLW